MATNNRDAEAFAVLDEAQMCLRSEVVVVGGGNLP